MQASPLLPRIVLLPGMVVLLSVLLISVVLSGTALAEYPFDPMMNAGPGGPGYAYDDYGLPEGYGYDEYGPDPALYELDDSYAGGELFGADTAIWPGFLSGTFQPGTDRTIGSGEWFQPLYQDGQTLWYFDFRGQGDSDSASEFNVGTGVRTLTDPGWIFGAYGFWDHLNSSNGNSFNQGMIGFEAMDVIWDARFNVYFPESGAESVGSPKAKVSNGNVVVQSSFERAYWGMDFEVGNLLWAWGPVAEYEVRGFLGGYYFDHSAPGTESIAGPRARLEWRWYDLPYFGPGSRLECGLTVQADQVRDGQLFAFARMRIPLDPWAHSRRRMTPLHRRMLDHVVRDVDVVSAVARRSEAAVHASTGRQIRGFERIDADTQFVGDVLDGVDEDALIVVDGRAGEITLPQSFHLKPGQTVLGGGSSLIVRGARTGQKATFEAGGTRPGVLFSGNAHIAWNGPTPSSELVWTSVMRPSPPGFVMNDRTRLIGVDVGGAQGGVIVHHADDVRIRDVSVSDFSGAGIDVDDSRNVMIDNVRVSDHLVTPYPIETVVDDATSLSETDIQPDGVGIFVRDSRDVRVKDSSVRNTTAEGIRVAASKDVTIERTSVRDTQREGIRLIDTKNVLIEDVELKYTGGKIPASSDWGLTNYRLIGSISLDGTENTVIRDSIIHASEGYGIHGKDATDTLIEGLDISDVEHGIWFDSLSPGHNITIADTTIRLPDEEFRAYPELPGFVTTFGEAVTTTGDVNGYIPHHSGIVVQDATGDVVISGNNIQGGYAGWGILAESGEPATNLRIEDNVIETYGESRGICLQTGNFDTLDALISGNTVHSGGEAFWLHASGHPDDPSNNVSKKLTLSDNELGGPIRARVLGSAELEMSVTGNLFGGDPMGFIRAEDDADVQLLYRENTSTPGAEPIRFENDGGTFNADVLDNDHQPTRIGDVGE